jgi:hypothetical protein
MISSCLNRNKGIIIMKINTGTTLTIIAVVGVLTLTGCGKKNHEAGAGERTGAALDEAAKKSAAKVDVVAEKIKDGTGKVVEKTGEVVEKVGESVNKAGERLQE